MKNTKTQSERIKKSNVKKHYSEMESDNDTMARKKFVRKPFQCGERK